MNVWASIGDRQRLIEASDGNIMEASAPLADLLLLNALFIFVRKRKYCQQINMSISETEIKARTFTQTAWQLLRYSATELVS